MAPRGGYDRLTALDESFLHLERPETPMHVGAVAVLERGSLLRRRRPVPPRRRARARRVAAASSSRASASGSWTCRSAAAGPIWVDDADFDIAGHVRLTALPAPGSRRQLLELAERLTAQVLDRDRPLWELWFVEGVDGGEHVGLVHKSHHTLTDGISGVDIATVLLDFDPRADACSSPAGGRPSPAPDPTRLDARQRRANA